VPIHLQPSYSDWRYSSALPVTEAEGGRTIALPFFNRITKDDVAYVCVALRAALLELRHN
jgi:perosamine synthetase